MSQQPPEFPPPIGPTVPPPPPPPAPPQFAAPNAGQPVYAPAPRTDGLAIASLCCSLGFLVISCLGIVTSILAIVFAVKARRRIRESNGALTGEGFAQAGLIIGWVGIGICVIGLIAYVLFFVLVLTNQDSSTAMGVLH